MKNGVLRDAVCVWAAGERSRFDRLPSRPLRAVRRMVFILIYIGSFTMPQTAKIFTTGRSQAVCLPLEFRFAEKEVFIRRDAATGDVILSLVGPSHGKVFFRTGQWQRRPI
jgi:virulence-associated protein VagC